MKWLLSLAMCGALLGRGGAGDIDFSRDVLPILSENCFHCHGPDEGARKAGLRLDTKEGAFRTKKDRSMIVPGKVAESEVISRIMSKDANEVMPPPDSNRKLTAKQIATLKQWVEEGAVWGQHWAYTPLPKSITVPSIPGISNPIDAFIRSRLAKEGLAPAPEASRAAWLRRVTFDLTGLPPTIAELDAFEADTSPQAYEKVVERLLASPRYGERMAADWLDVARYADTHGYQSDRFRPMWPYRDWVIRAFNENRKFDRFAIEQLAGDLLPNANQDQRLATAFNRLHMQNEEGGVVEEEFRVAYVVDRVTTFGTAFLAQTMECCRCHDHKYDPFSQKDFYQLFAFFQNIDESGQTSYFTSSMPVPTLLLTTAEQDAKIAELERAIASKEAALRTVRMAARDRFPAWLKTWEQSPSKEIPVPGLVAHFPFDELMGNKSPNRVDKGPTANGHDGPAIVPGTIDKAIELNGENGFDIPGVGHFSRSDPFSITLWLRSSKHQPRAVVLHHSKAPIDAGSRGYELLLENGRVAFGLHHMWPGNSLKVVTKAAIPTGDWVHVAVTYDGSSRANGVTIAIQGEPAACDVVRDGLRKDITYEGGEPSLQIGYRFRDNGFKGGAVDDLRIYSRALTELELAQIAKRTVKLPRRSLEDYYLANENADVQRAVSELQQARSALVKFINPIPEAMVMQELPKPKPAYVLKRGAYDAPGETVTLDTPKVLPPFPANAPRNRLGLAQWLTQPDHPLFARVIVNRLWQQMFGKGLVETSDNFGTTGVPPSHPDLLDWLARDFAKDWDVKRVLAQMALSATYRQSSKASPELLRKDPYNLLLARAPVRRLTAEMLRDQALVVSGLLNETIGGPSVYPYQPEGLWNEAMGRPHYPQSRGRDLYRRSLYTVWKRTAPHPQMTTFDAADRSNCAVRRQSTSTPLQALALLNDVQFVEASRTIGQKMVAMKGTPADRVNWLFRTITGRAASPSEIEILLKLFDEQQAEFSLDRAAAMKLIAVGESKPDAKIDPIQLAAATQLALAVLNHDAAVNRR